MVQKNFYVKILINYLFAGTMFQMPSVSGVHSFMKSKRIDSSAKAGTLKV